MNHFPEMNFKVKNKRKKGICFLNSQNFTISFYALYTHFTFCQGAFFCLKTCPLILICVSAMHIHQKVPKNFLARVQVLYFFFDPLYFSFMNPKTDPKIGGRFDHKFFSRGVRIFVTALRRRKNWGLFEGVAIAIYTS